MFDAPLKIVFSNPVMVRLLIESQLPHWANLIDFSTLEPRRTEVITTGFGRRLMDVLWVCRTKDGALVVILVIELQRDPERRMAVRTEGYRSLAVQQEDREYEGRGKPLPKYRALALVLHHGEGAWTAPTHCPELHGDDGDEVYQVVSPTRPFGKPDPTPHDLPLLVLNLTCKMTDQQAEAEVELVTRAVGLVRLPGRDSLDEHVVGVGLQLLKSMGIKIPKEKLKGVKTMQGMTDLMQRSLRATALRNVEKGERRGVEKGRREGRREGRQEGRREARLALLCRMAARKFDAETVRELAALLERMADPGLLDEAADAVMDCDESEELLRAARRLANGGNSAR